MTLSNSLLRTRANGLILASSVGMVLMLAVTATPCRAAGTTITVDSTNDPGGSGECALRDAITAANTSANVGACNGAGGGPFTIQFSADLAGGTITLGSTLPAITSGTDLTITGPNPLSSAGITISGNNSVQIMEINSGATVTLQLQALSLVCTECRS